MPEIRTIIGIEQGRAKFAFECAEEAKQQNITEYKSYAKKMPMLIKTNGLGATLSFIISKEGKSEGKAYTKLGNHIQTWITKNAKTKSKFDNVNNFHDFTFKVLQLDSTDYRAITIEVLGLLNWIRRFADGLIEAGD